ncbi:MAG: o-succinylbenzoate synthase [Nostocoides sp.]
MRLPPLADLIADMHVVALPLVMPFRGVNLREVALLPGPSGWGEFGPFLEYGPQESARWLAAAIEAAYGTWPEPVRTAIPVNATVPAVDAGAVFAVLDRYDGCTTAKVKVAQRGQSLSDDLDRVAAVRDVLGPGGRIRIDANGAWDVDQAVHAIGALAAYGLEYAEQPCASTPDLAQVRVALARAGIDVPIAADESIRKAADPLEVARRQAADLVVVKVAPLGGVRTALEIVADTGLPAVVSSAIDSSVGIRAGVALAAALPALPYACGLGTVELLTADVADVPLVPRAGALPVGAVDVSTRLVLRHSASSERVAWWRERMAAAYAVLAARPGP